MKKNLVTESVTAFIARGGKVTKVPAKNYAAKRPRQQTIEGKHKDIDVSLLPESLKIALGLK